MPNRDLYGPARDVLAAFSAGDAPRQMQTAMAALARAMAPLPTPAQLRAAGKIEEADKAAETLIDETAGRIVGENVKLCVSWLVSELMAKAGERDSIMDEDEAATLASRAPDVDDFRDALPKGYIVEQVTDPADGAPAWRWYEDDGEAAPDVAVSDLFEDEEEALRDLFEQERLDEPDGSEAFEHWAVSSWLADKLRAKGESVVQTNWAGWVWARCTTGQMIRMDYVIRQIARDLCADELEGGAK